MAPLTKFVEEPFVPDEYVAPRGILRMHAYPRWGKPNQPVYLSSQSSEDEKQDYLTGVIIGSLIIFMVFTVWALVLLGLKCAGRRVGCASGVPRKPRRPQPTSVTDNGKQQQQQQEEQGQEQAKQEQAAEKVKQKGGSLRGSAAFGSASVRQEPDRGSSFFGSTASGSRHSSQSKPERLPSGVQEWLKSMEDDGLHDEASHAILAARDPSSRTVGDLSPSGHWQVASRPVPDCVQDWLDEMHSGTSDEEEEEEEEYESAIMAAAKSGGLGAALAAARKESSRVFASSPPPEYEVEMEQWRTAVRKFDRRMNALRIVFLACCVSLIVASALFYSKGLMSLKNSLEEAQGTLSYSEGVLASAHNLTEVYLDSREIVKEEADNMRYSTDEFCPVASSALAILNFTEDEIATIEESIDNVTNALGSLGDLIQEEVTNLQTDLVSAMDTAAYANDALENAYPFLYAGAAVMGVQIFITLALMVEVILTWRGKKMRNCFVACMKNGVILPIFFIFLLLGWLFASLFLLAAISGADFCAAPDNNVMTLLNSAVESGKFSSSLVDYFRYFVACEGQLKPAKIPQEANLVFDAIGVLHKFSEYLASDESIAGRVCGAGGANLVRSLASIVHINLHAINFIFIELLSLLQCSTFNPMYTSAVYNVLCINGVDGLTWMFACQLAIAVCSMIMITIRAARQDVEGSEYYPVSEESRTQLAVDPVGGDEGPDPQMAAAAATAGAAAAGATYVFPCEQESTDGGRSEGVGSAASAGDSSVNIEALGESSRALEIEDEYYAILETLTLDQKDAIEAIASTQDHTGVKMSEEECVGHLREVRPELSDDQIEAVVALELLSGEGEHVTEAHDEENNLAAAGNAPQATEDYDANVEILETLTDTQREYIEAVGIAQEAGGQMSEEEIFDSLKHVPGITEEQIKAVIALEMASRESQ